MNTDKVEESNRLIAEFDDNVSQSFDTYFHKVKNHHFLIKDAEYHTSWDWISAPCKKYIEMDGKIFNDGSLYGNPKDAYYGYVKDIKTAFSNIDTEEAFTKLVVAINWYNQNKTS